MLVPQGRFAPADDGLAGAGQGSLLPRGLLDVRGFWLFLRRRARLIGAVTAGALALAALALAVIPARYTATAVLLVDPRQQRVVQSEAVLSGIGADAAAVESQVEVIESTSLARRVVDDLRLPEDPGFTRVPVSERVATLLRETFGAARPPETAEERHRRALARLKDNLKVQRRGLTYVIEVGFVAEDAQQAAKVANAVAAAYLADQASAKLEATTRASGWLDERLRELRTKLGAAEHAVARYKAEHNIVDAGEGRTLAERQLTELNQQLVLARARTAEVRSRLDQVRKTSASLGTAGSLPEALQSPVIANLRTQYAQAARGEAELTSTYGPLHPAIGTMKAQLADLRRQIDSEIARIAAGLRNEFESAQGREQSLEASVAALKRQSGTTDQAAVRLRELEREAQASRTLLEQFLLRFKETSEQQGLQTPDARIISPASAPLRRTSPQPGLVLAFGLVGGLVLGIGAATLAEGLARGFRTAREVEDALSLPVIGLLPRVGASDDPTRLAIDRPLTPFGQGVRSIRMRVRSTEGPTGSQVLLVASALAGEGKSTLAINLARVFARQGCTTLLIDADVRNPTLSQRLGKADGLLKVLREEHPVEPLLETDPASGLRLLPLGTIDDVGSASELLTSDKVGPVLDRLRQDFEVIVLDGPALLSSVDGRQLLEHADLGLLVVAWAGTDRDNVAAALEAIGPNVNRMAGAVLNKVDLRRYRLYDHGRSDPSG